MAETTKPARRLHLDDNICIVCNVKVELNELTTYLQDPHSIEVCLKAANIKTLVQL